MKKPLAIVLVLAVAAATAVVALGVVNATAPASVTTPTTSDRFTSYTPEAVSSATSDDQVVLFFHATWCSTCKLLADDITANADAIPDNVRILLVDYDTATALKQRYGVTLQHTLVQVDASGTALGTWHLTRTLDELLDELNGGTT